jgi:transposase-like protein
MAIAKIYTDETAARKHLEKLLWPEGPVCPHCGVVNEATLLKGESTRPGVYKCRPCEKPFSVTVGTVFEGSKIKLNVWVYATDLLTASKKGISSHQLSRMLKVSYKTAWFMSHRIREAMRDMHTGPMGGSGKVVESDETFIGNAETHRSRKGTSIRARGTHHKRKVLTLVERDGRARSFHVEDLKVSVIAPIIRQNISRESTLSTDEARHYRRLGKEFAKHLKVEHGDDQYVDGLAHVNTAEGFFSIFKRGMKGIYQHCGEQHLHRYLAEFDFRYNERSALGVNDAKRGEKALKGITGKRLTYRRPNEIAQEIPF